MVPAMDLVIVRNGLNFLNDFDQVPALSWRNLSVPYRIHAIGFFSGVPIILLHGSNRLQSIFAGNKMLSHMQVYGKDFFTGIASCIPAQAAPKQQVVVAKGMAQEMEFALGNALAADVDTSSQV